MTPITQISPTTKPIVAAIAFPGRPLIVRDAHVAQSTIHVMSGATWRTE